MGKTILELFRSRNESNGEVAEKKYAPRNSKDIGIQTNSFLINNTAVYAVNFARRNFGNRIGETFLEEDGILGIGGVGIRPLYTLSTPILHGTDLLRLESQRTNQTEGMKESAIGGGGTGTLGSDGILGGGIQKLKAVATSGLEKLGAKFPSDINPTVVYTDSELKNTKNIAETPSILSEFKGDAAGNLLGKALSQPATPGQLVKNVAGAAVSGIKKKARGTVFGNRSTTAFNNATTGSLANNITFNYGEADNSIAKQDVKLTQIDAQGRRYSKTFDLKNPDRGPNDTKFTFTAETESSAGFFGLAEKYTNVVLPHFSRRTNGVGGSKLYSKTFNVSSASIDVNEFDKNNNVRYGTETPKPNWINASIEGNLETTDDPGLAGKTPNVQLPHVTDRVTNEGLSKYSLLRNNMLEGETKDIFDQSLTVRRGMRNGADIINQSGVIDSGNTRRTQGGQALKTSEATSNLGWHYDFIPLKINRLNDNKTIYFRSTVTGLTETFSPSWDSAKFIGNPFNYYTYSGIDRSVSFSLKVYALNGREMVSMWDKLKFLAELTYPAGYTTTSAVIAPFINFTLGSFYDRKVGFIESLSYTVDDNTPWEVGLNTVRSSGDMKDEGKNREYPYFFEVLGNERNVEDKLKGPVDKTPLDNYRLPMIVDVQMNVKFVESRINTTNAKLYDFGNAGSA